MDEAERELIRRVQRDNGGPQGLRAIIEGGATLALDPASPPTWATVTVQTLDDHRQAFVDALNAQVWGYPPMDDDDKAAYLDHIEEHRRHAAAAEPDPLDELLADAGIQNDHWRRTKRVPDPLFRR